MLFTVLGAAVGLIGGFYLKELQLKRNKALSQLLTAMKKKDRWIGFLESDKTTYFRTVIKFYKNLAITPEREIIIFPEASVKPCPDLGGVMVFHGDLYKSIATTRDLRMFFFELKRMGWSDNEIAHFLRELEIKNPDKILENLVNEIQAIRKKRSELEEKLAKFENASDEEKKQLAEEIEETRNELEALMNREKKLNQKIDVFLGLPSTVKNFVYTGLNRVLIHNIIHELVYQRELEKLKEKDWLKLGAAIFLIAIALIFIIKALPSVLHSLGVI